MLRNPFSTKASKIEAEELLCRHHGSHLFGGHSSSMPKNQQVWQCELNPSHLPNEWWQVQCKGCQRDAAYAAYAAKAQGMGKGGKGKSYAAAAAASAQQDEWPTLPSWMQGKGKGKRIRQPSKAPKPGPQVILPKWVQLLNPEKQKEYLGYQEELETLSALSKSLVGINTSESQRQNKSIDKKMADVKHDITNLKPPTERKAVLNDRLARLQRAFDKKADEVKKVREEKHDQQAEIEEIQELIAKVEEEENMSNASSSNNAMDASMSYTRVKSLGEELKEMYKDKMSAQEFKDLCTKLQEHCEEDEDMEDDEDQPPAAPPHDLAKLEEEEQALLEQIQKIKASKEDIKGALSKGAAVRSKKQDVVGKIAAEASQAPQSASLPQLPPPLPPPTAPMPPGTTLHQALEMANPRVQAAISDAPLNIPPPPLHLLSAPAPRTPTAEPRDERDDPITRRHPERSRSPKSSERQQEPDDLADEEEEERLARNFAAMGHPPADEGNA